ncbi:MAG: hypothetical protein IPP87_26095 [Ideonella sp.]|nr:hypothetical protein [Ideonella sp.]
MHLTSKCVVVGLMLAFAGIAAAQSEPSSAAYDESLAKSVGADERGMRSFVLVILKTGPNKMPAGPERDEMFRGHFANMKRLSDAGKLVQAGPLDGVDGWRGLYVFAVADIEEARSLVATDPVVAKGEMIPELHRYYGTAALMMIPGLHAKVSMRPI